MTGNTAEEIPGKVKALDGVLDQIAIRSFIADDTMDQTLIWFKLLRRNWQR